ncbi:MAG: hypothetical protein EXR07_07390 [Acetobacteraceae bacterium]|nr:hypothetical protein [Acetobacteraceae bacterium]
MPRVNVDGLIFEFHDIWTVSKYDEWRFYRDRLIPTGNDLKAVDLLAIGPDRAGWLIEVKDYTKMEIGREDRPPASDLARFVARKIFDTLAAILLASMSASDGREKSVALSMTNATRLRVVLHLEQPARKSSVWSRTIDPANIHQKLRRLLKPVDPRVIVASMRQMGRCDWDVVRP